MLPTKIVVVGAGSASFGLNTLATLLRTDSLWGGRLALVDSNATQLARIERLADRLKRSWGVEMAISAHLHHEEALAEAQFVVCSLEVGPREALWRSDFEIPLKYGVRQPYAENGGPGGFAHAARNLVPVMQIVRDMEQICPQAWFINLTNPMIRICESVARYSRIRVAGLCHGINTAYAMVGRTLADHLDIEVPPEFTDTAAHPDTQPARQFVARQAKRLLDIRAAGINHFTWMMALHERSNGDDLYPLFLDCWAAGDPDFEPLTRRMVEVFGLLPCIGDTHICEYLPWASDPISRPWEKFNLRLFDWDLAAQKRDTGHLLIEQLGRGEISPDPLLEVESEGVDEVILAIAGDANRYHSAINIPNRGSITNLPEEAIVEVPVMIDGTGIHGLEMGRLPHAIAELCRRELTVAGLCVDAAVKGDYQAAMQCLLLDPVITDLDTAKVILDDYLETYQAYLPQFA